MAGKNFTDIAAEPVYSNIENATATPAPQEIPRRHRSAGETATAEDIQAAREQGRTQGRKGVKMVRINMAFSPKVHDFIRTMARVRGESVTQFTNYVFEKSMEENADLYEQAQQFKDSFT